MIVIDTVKISNDILDEIINISPRFVQSCETAKNAIKQIVYNSIVNSTEYHAMIPGGAIYHEIGNPRIESDLQVIIHKILEQIEFIAIIPHVVGQTVEASFTINILNTDYQEILSLPEAQFITEHGQNLKWLEWLLLDGGGDSIVIGYHYVAKYHTISRTEFGFMAKGGNWTAAPIAGTTHNNWLTRAMDGIESDIQNIIEREFNNI